MEEKEIHACFQNVFDTQDGKTALALILNKCGYFANDPKYISPDLFAFCNWLLTSIGTLGTSGMANYIDCMLEAARRNNNND